MRLVKREDLHKLISSLLEDFEIIGPKDLPNKGIFYQSLKNVEDLYLGEGFTTEPIKKFFLEPSLWIFKHTQDKEFDIETVPQSDKKRIVIGARPCEVRGLVLLDKVFDSEYKDSSYINNRNRTIIVGMACNKPDESCFCTSIGGSPVDSCGMDVLIFDVNGKFALDILTDKGKDVFGSVGEDLDKSQKGSPKLDKEKKKDLVKKKITVPEDLDKVFESDYWITVSRPCISCGVCTYLCPTCHCFDLVDEERKKLRCYDGCAFPDFTLEASGENPRPSKMERYRQRVFHKFYYFKKNFGEDLCVGCGRCIRYCPVKIDIAQIVDKIPATEGSPE